MRTFNVAAIFTRGHPYIWRTTVRHDTVRHDSLTIESLNPLFSLIWHRSHTISLTLSSVPDMLCMHFQNDTAKVNINFEQWTLYLLTDILSHLASTLTVAAAVLATILSYA